MLSPPLASFAGLTGESMPPQGADGEMDPPVKPEGDASGVMPYPKSGGLPK